MKQQDITLLRQKSPAALIKDIIKLEETLVTTRIKRGLGQVKNVHTEQLVRKDIARIKTIMREMELAAVETTTKELKTAKAAPVVAKKKSVATRNSAETVKK